MLPARVQLPVRYHIHVREDCERELRYLGAIGPNEGAAVDVGANRGVYTYALAGLYDRVVAFEANPELLGLLRAYNHERIEIIPKGLSSTTGQVVLHTPVFRGKRLTGWATLNPEIYPQVEQFEQQSVEVTTLDSFELRDVGFIKIDVEGHELAVLKGSEETLRRCRPTVLVEIKQQHLAAIHGFMDGLGYEIKRLNQIVEAEPSGNNCIFLPRG